MDFSKCWDFIPDHLLLSIFSHLDASNLLNAGKVCHSWNRVACDDFLWRELFYVDFKIERNIPIAPGRSSWRCEYKRLKYHTPTVETETLCEHTHQVLHVSYSNDGRMFASSSKDGFIKASLKSQHFSLSGKVWNASYPASVRYSADMKDYSWNYTQFSQFNSTDTLLLVSGVHFGAHTASGEIAVFNLQDGFILQCRVLNKPYDLFGTWYTDNYLLAGRLHFLGHLISCSALWLNKASQESESERMPIVKRLFKFYNKNASSIRTIMVANCLFPEEPLNGNEGNNGLFPNPPLPPRPTSGSNLSDTIVKGNPVSHNALSSSQWSMGAGSSRQTQQVGSGPYMGALPNSWSQDVKVEYGAESREACTMDSPIRYSQEYRRAESEEDFLMEQSANFEDEEESPDFEDPPLPWQEEWHQLEEDAESSPECKAADPCSEECDETGSDEECFDRLLDHREKFLIFTTGSLTYTPHQIGFKRIKPFKFPERVRETATLSQRLVEQEERRSATPNSSPGSLNPDTLANMFDKIDHVIELNGHIIGMGLSPDHRYLYVNSRPWPKNCVIEHPLNPPPIAQEIDIHVIDLMTLKEVGTMLQSHKAYTPNDECFFIFLDVSDQYVASGAEDKHGYLWDRHYGNCLARLPHKDVVNSVAFSPKDPEILVTASDDYTLKVWRSKNRIHRLHESTSS